MNNREREQAYQKIKSLVYEMFERGDLKIDIDEKISYGYENNSNTKRITIKILNDKNKPLSISTSFYIDF